jgi:hypothetical protein
LGVNPALIAPFYIYDDVSKSKLMSRQIHTQTATLTTVIGDRHIDVTTGGQNSIFSSFCDEWQQVCRYQNDLSLLSQNDSH